MRILVVDDDPPTRELLARSLGRAGHVASVAASCQHAEAMARGEHFDVLVLDVMLPDGSGLDPCRALRQERVKTPILKVGRMAWIQVFTMVMPGISR
jgi:two-component system OmpR family response regulator